MKALLRRWTHQRQMPMGTAMVLVKRMDGSMQRVNSKPKTIDPNRSSNPLRLYSSIPQGRVPRRTLDWAVHTQALPPGAWSHPLFYQRPRTQGSPIQVHICMCAWASVHMCAFMHLSADHFGVKCFKMVCFGFEGFWGLKPPKQFNQKNGFIYTSNTARH